MSEKLKVFDGEIHLFPMWETRMEGKIRKKGLAVWDAAKQTGPFKGFRFDEANAAERILVPIEALREAGLTDLGTPIAKSLSFATPTKKDKGKQEGEGGGDQEKKSFEPGDLRKSIQYIYNFMALSVWDVIVENVSDEVLEELLTVDGLVNGDGPRALKELKRIYHTGTKVNILLKFRRYVRLSQVKDCDGEFRKFDYEFQQLQTYFSSMKAEELMKMLTVLIYLEGLDAEHDRIRDRIYDDSHEEIPELKAVRKRVKNWRETQKLSESRESDLMRESASFVPPRNDPRNKEKEKKTKPKFKKFADMNAKEKKVFLQRVMKCRNCKTKHKGGEFACKKPCGICGKQGHVRYNCPEKKTRNDGKRSGNPAGEIAQMAGMSFGIDLGLMMMEGDTLGMTVELPKVKPKCKAISPNTADPKNRTFSIGEDISSHEKTVITENSPKRNRSKLVKSPKLNGPRNRTFSFGYPGYQETISGNQENESDRQMALMSSESLRNTRRRVKVLDGGAVNHYLMKDDVKGVHMENVTESKGVVGTASESTTIEYDSVADVGPLKEARLCGPKLSAHLISVGRLCDDHNIDVVHTKDAAYQFPKGCIDLRKGKKIATRGTRTNNLYVCRDKMTEDKALLVPGKQMDNPLEQWHIQSGHRSLEFTLKMIRKGKIKNAKILELMEKHPETFKKHLKNFRPCRECGECKTTRTNRRTSPSEATMNLKVGELWIADMIWPIRPAGPNGENGLIFLVEAKTGYGMPPVAIKRKSQAIPIITEFLRPIVKRLPKDTKTVSLVTLRVDDEKALTSEEAAKSLGTIGVRLTNSAGHHLNGIAKVDRLMRTIQAGMRVTMRGLNGKIPPKEWPHAARQAMEVSNMMPNKEGKIPIQECFGIDPGDLGMNLKPFYCPVFVKHSPNERHKSERIKPTAFFGFYLGRPKGMRGHLVRVPGKRQPVARHDVVFMQDLDRSLQMIKKEDGLESRATRADHSGNENEEKNESGKNTTNRAEDPGQNDSKGTEGTRKPLAQTRGQVGSSTMTKYNGNDIGRIQKSNIAQNENTPNNNKHQNHLNPAGFFGQNHKNRAHIIKRALSGVEKFDPRVCSALVKTPKKMGSTSVKLPILKKTPQDQMDKPRCVQCGWRGSLMCLPCQQRIGKLVKRPLGGDLGEKNGNSSKMEKKVNFDESDPSSFPIQKETVPNMELTPPGALGGELGGKFSTSSEEKGEVADEASDEDSTVHPTPQRNLRPKEDPQSSQNDQKMTVSSALDQIKSDLDSGTEELLRRSSRETKNVPPLRMGIHDEAHLARMLIKTAHNDNRVHNQLKEIAFAAIGECPIPKSWREARGSPEWPQWEEAAQKELNNMAKHDVWEEVVPTGKERIMNLILRFEKKRDANGIVRKYKVRMCADGRSQEAGIDFDKTFAPTIPAAVMRMMMAIIVEADLETLQFDVSGAFLNALQDKDLHVRCPPGFKRKIPGSILRLKRALYGQKQSAMLWHATLKAELEKLGYRECRTAKCLFVRAGPDGEPDFMLIHVDDGIVTGSNKKALNEVMTQLAKRFDLTQGEMDFYLGNKIDRDRREGTIKMSAPAYISELLKKFKMDECNPKHQPACSTVNLEKNTGDKRQCPFMEIVGALLHLQGQTRPDITQATCRLARYMQNPSNAHWTAVKHTLAYLKGSKQAGIIFRKSKRWKLEDSTLDRLKRSVLNVYSDSDYATDRNGRKSCTGTVIYLNDNLIHWFSKKQKVTAQSSCEAELIAATDATKMAMYLRKVLAEVIFLAEGKDNSEISDSDIKAKVVNVYSDSQAMISAVQNGDFTGKLKHIDTRFYYMADVLQAGKINLTHVPGKENPADLFTKPVSKMVWNHLIDRVIHR